MNSLDAIGNMEYNILNKLMTDGAFFSKVYPELKNTLFNDPNNILIFDTITDYTKKYDNAPSPQDIGMSIKQSNNINDTLKPAVIKNFKEILTSGSEAPINPKFLEDEIAYWIRKQRITESIFESASIIKEGGDFGPIVQMFEDALNVNFDDSTGHDYNASLAERLDYYKDDSQFTPLGIPSIDEILGGGIRPGSLFLFLGPTHTGKTAAKVFTTANLLLKGENVLFVTLEMPEKEIAKRIDANILGVTIDELRTADKDEMLKRFDDVKDNLGQLMIKEYGAGQFTTLHLKALLIKLKKETGFVPDAIVIDYLGLMVSHRSSSTASSYDQLGNVAEDLHSFAKENYDSKGNKYIKMISSSQAGRAAMGNTEAGMENIAESLKVAMTADVVIMLINDEKMKQNNQQLWKFVKNRYTGNMGSSMLETEFGRMMYSDYDTEKAYDTLDDEMSAVLDPVKGDLLGDFNFDSLEL